MLSSKTLTNLDLALAIAVINGIQAIDKPSKSNVFLSGGASSRQVAPVRRVSLRVGQVWRFCAGIQCTSREMEEELSSAWWSVVNSNSQKPHH